MSVDLSTGHHDASAVDRLAPSAGVHINDSRLRAPQKDAYAAAREHFSRTQEPAIIQMPVGCGKSGLAGLLALGLSDTRTLIVTPNTTIRRGIAEELDPGSPSSFWAKTGVLDDGSAGPQITVIDGPKVSMNDCAASDVVIANIQQLTHSSKMWIYGFTQDFFDLVVFDEGHHSAADSWQLVATIEWEGDKPTPLSGRGSTEQITMTERTLDAGVGMASTHHEVELERVRGMCREAGETVASFVL